MADITAAKATVKTVPSSVDKDRLNKWAFLCLFSVLALTAHQTDDMVKHAYITVCASSSIVLSGLASFAHVGSTSISALFVGTVIEGLVSLIVVGLWAAALPIIMNPANGLAQMYVGKAGSDIADYQATIANANLFFTSWGAGVCALSVLAMYIRESFSGAGGMGMSYIAYWYLLMLTSVIVIIESATFKNQVCGIEGGTEDVTCGRNIYGLVTGCIGLIVSFVISLSSSLGKDSALITTVSGFIMAVLYTLCAGLMTFDNGPATYVGNHYFSAWAGFFLSFAVFGGVLKEFLGVGTGMASTAVVSDDNPRDDGEFSDVEIEKI